MKLRRLFQSESMFAFALKFILLSGVFLWLAGEKSTLSTLNHAIRMITRAQALMAGYIINGLGGAVDVVHTTIKGGTFSCEVDTGCDGMIALSLVLAGILSLPATWRKRILGTLVLVPAILTLNVFRIAGLYWLGAHWPEWFGVVHVYVAQVIVITITTALWLIWLSWNSPSASHSSPS